MKGFYMSKESDEQLLKSFQQGCEEAFHELFRRYELPLIRYVSSMCTSYEEIVQDTFLQLVNKPPHFLFGKSLKSWLFRVAHNRSIDALRKKGKEVVSDEILNTFADESLRNPGVASKMSDDIRLMKTVLDELPEQYREVVSLHIFGDLTFKEVAKIMKIPLGTALWRMQKALSILKLEMTRKAGGEV